MEAAMRVCRGTDGRWGWGERNGARMEKGLGRGWRRKRDRAGLEVRGGLGEEVETDTETELGTWKRSGKSERGGRLQAESPGSSSLWR